MSEAPVVNKKVLGLFALAMINVAAVLSIRNFPSMAVYGWSCIGWYIIGAILFLIPISLAGAELASQREQRRTRHRQQQHPRHRAARAVAVEEKAAGDLHRREAEEEGAGERAQCFRPDRQVAHQVEANRDVGRPKKMAGDMMADDMKSMKKVTIAAPDTEGLKMGLEKAEDVVEGMPGMEMEDEDL